MPVYTVIISDDLPATTELGFFSLKVHLTSSNILSASSKPDDVVPVSTTNRILAASIGGVSLAAAEAWPTASFNSQEFKQLVASVKPNNIVVEFENSNIPIDSWRYQIYAHGVMSGNSSVSSVEVYHSFRLAVLTYVGSMHAASGYSLGVIISNESQITINPEQATSAAEVARDSLPPWVTAKPVRSYGTSASSKTAYVNVSKRGFESWRLRSLNLDEGSDTKRQLSRSVVSEPPFFVNTQLAAFDNTAQTIKSYGSEHPTTGRSPDRGATISRDNYVRKVRSADTDYFWQQTAGSTLKYNEATGRHYLDFGSQSDSYAETASNKTGMAYERGAINDGGVRLVIVELEKTENKTLGFSKTGGSLSGVVGPLSGGVRIVSEGVICGGDSLNKVLPAILRAFGSTLAVMRGEPITRTLETIYMEVQTKVGLGYLVGQVRVESTLGFPKTLAHGPYTVWIDGHKFVYAHASSGCEAILLDLVSTDFIRSDITPGAEVILEVPSLTPELIGLI